MAFDALETAFKGVSGQLSDSVAALDKERAVVAELIRERNLLASEAAGLHRNHKLTPERHHRKTGTMAGKVEVADDFDEPDVTGGGIWNPEPAPDHHNARRLAWREYASRAGGPHNISVDDWADRMLSEEEKRFGEIK